MLYAAVHNKDIVIDEGLYKIKEPYRFMESHNMSDIIVHAPFSINLATRSDSEAKVAVKTLMNALQLTASLKSQCLVLPYFCNEPVLGFIMPIFKLGPKGDNQNYISADESYIKA